LHQLVHVSALRSWLEVQLQRLNLLEAIRVCHDSCQPHFDL
jgi:hypothetical protein